MFFCSFCRYPAVKIGCILLGLSRFHWVAFMRFAHQRLKLSLHVRAWYGQSFGRRDRDLPIDLPRMKASLYRWLCQPWNPTDWLLSGSGMFVLGLAVLVASVRTASSATSEPSSLLLFGSGVLALSAFVRKRLRSHG